MIKSRFETRANIVYYDGSFFVVLPLVRRNYMSMTSAVIRPMAATMINMIAQVGSPLLSSDGGIPGGRKDGGGGEGGEGGEGCVPGVVEHGNST